MSISLISEFIGTNDTNVIVYKVSGTEGHPKTLVIVPFLPWSFCNDDAYRPNVTEIVYTLFVATFFVVTFYV